MTRARRHLAIVCDMKTLGKPHMDKQNQKAFLVKWIDWLEAEKVVKGSKKSI